MPPGRSLDYHGRSDLGRREEGNRFSRPDHHGQDQRDYGERGDSHFGGRPDESRRLGSRDQEEGQAQRPSHMQGNRFGDQQDQYGRGESESRYDKHPDRDRSDRYDRNMPGQGDPHRRDRDRSPVDRRDNYGRMGGPEGQGNRPDEVGRDQYSRPPPPRPSERDRQPEEQEYGRSDSRWGGRPQDPERDRAGQWGKQSELPVDRWGRKEPPPSGPQSQWDDKKSDWQRGPPPPPSSQSPSQPPPGRELNSRAVLNRPTERDTFDVEKKIPSTQWDPSWGGRKGDMEPPAKPLDQGSQQVFDYGHQSTGQRDYYKSSEQGHLEESRNWRSESWQRQAQPHPEAEDSTKESSQASAFNLGSNYARPPPPPSQSRDYKAPPAWPQTAPSPSEKSSSWYSQQTKQAEPPAEPEKAAPSSWSQQEESKARSYYESQYNNWAQQYGGYGSYEEPSPKEDASSKLKQEEQQWADYWKSQTQAPTAGATKTPATTPQVETWSTTGYSGLPASTTSRTSTAEAQPQQAWSWGPQGWTLTSSPAPPPAPPPVAAATSLYQQPPPPPPPEDEAPKKRKSRWGTSGEPEEQSTTAASAEDMSSSWGHYQDMYGQESQQAAYGGSTGTLPSQETSTAAADQYSYGSSSTAQDPWGRSEYSQAALKSGYWESQRVPEDTPRSAGHASLHDSYSTVQHHSSSTTSSSKPTASWQQSSASQQDSRPATSAGGAGLLGAHPNEPGLVEKYTVDSSKVGMAVMGRGPARAEAHPGLAATALAAPLLGGIYPAAAFSRGSAMGVFRGARMPYQPR